MGGDAVVRLEALRYGLPQRTNEILAMRQPAWGMQVDMSLPLVPGQSRLGGVPDAPANFDWPHSDDVPSRFIMQIRLDALPRHPVESLHALLPASGLLLLFTNPDIVTELPSAGNEGAFARYVPPGVELIPTQSPSTSDWPSPLRPCPLAIKPIWTIPSTCDDLPEYATWSEEEIKALDDWEWESEGFGNQQLLGVSSPLQTPIESPENDELGPSWCVLCQINSDSDCDLDIYGTALLAIEKEALRRHDFRRVAVIPQFT